MPYIPRTLEKLVKKAVKEFPAVIVTGPRQAGKTTLFKRLYSETHKYISLEPPDVRMAAVSDPRGFIELYPPPVIFDEIQYAPDLLFYIKEKIDNQRDSYGQYLLTGSQNLLLLQQVTETLAGRAAILRLLPLSYAEIQGKPEKKFIWEEEEQDHSILPVRDFWNLIQRGCYPELIEHPEREASLWQGSYIQTYLERDVRHVRQVGDLTQFQLFIRSIAARSGQLLQLSDLARELGIAVNTARTWLAVLEATYQVLILRPYFANIQKRLVKSPKVYLTDVGLLCYLLGLRDVDALIAGPMAGKIAETFIVVDIYKRMLYQGIDPELYFWRTATGTEVDLLVAHQGRLIPLEIKSTSTPKPAMAEPISSFQRDLGDKAREGYLIHLGELPLPLVPRVTALPFACL